MKSVFFDIETASLADTAPIIQLAAIAVNEDTWEELGTFNRLLTFDEAKAEPEALKINHYDRARWQKEAVAPAQVVAEFSKFLDGYKSLTLVSKRTGQPYKVAKLVGHNADRFDGPRLQRMFRLHNAFLPADPRCRCSCQRAMWWFDERGLAPESYKLEALCRYFKIPVPDGAAHDALADVRLTIQLARAMREAEVQSHVSAA